MKGYVYITTNKNKTVLYVGATDDIKRRMNEHKNRIYPNAFTKKYNCDILVYFEEFENGEDSFKRELKLKAGNRKKKEELINSMNPEWGDFSINWLDDNFKFRNKK